MTEIKLKTFHILWILLLCVFGPVGCFSLGLALTLGWHQTIKFSDGQELTCPWDSIRWESRSTQFKNALETGCGDSNTTDLFTFDATTRQVLSQTVPRSDNGLAVIYYSKPLHEEAPPGLIERCDDVTVLNNDFSPLVTFTYAFPCLLPSGLFQCKGGEVTYHRDHAQRQVYWVYCNGKNIGAGEIIGEGWQNVTNKYTEY